MDNNEKKINDQAEDQEIKDYDYGVPKVNRKFAIVVISVFISILVLPTLLWGVLKIANLANPAIMEKINFATDENRNMAKFPDKFDPKTITSDIETWYNDNLPFRSVIYTAQDKLNKAIEKPYDEKLLPALITLFHSSDSPDGEDPSDEVLEGLITEETEEDPFEETEEETLPVFETEETGNKDCQHVLDSGKIETQPTCTDYGVIKYSCTLCTYSYREYVKKAEHVYELTAGTLQNCLADSEATYSCVNCDKSYTKSAKRGHNGPYIRTVEASYSDFGYDLHLCDTCGTEYRTKITAKKVDNSYFPLRYSNDAILGRDDWLFYRGSNSLGFYQGTNMMSQDELAYYTALLQNLQTLCDEKGIKLLFMILPNKEQMYAEHMPTVTVETDYKRTEAFVDYVKQNSNVNIIFPQDELKAAKPYWRVYYKYDTHWNKAGAFIGTQEMYKALGLESTNLLYLPVEETPRVYNGKPTGDLISIGGIDPSNLTPDIEHVITYKPDVEVTLVAGSENNGEYHKTTSSIGNDLNMLFVGDSFRVNMLPYISKDFSNCLVAHRDYHIGSAVFNEALAKTDYLVIETVERYDTAICHVANAIYNILIKIETE